MEANIRLASALMQDRLSAKGLKALATKAHGIIDKKKHTKKVHFAQVIVDAWEDDFGSIPETALAAGEAVFPTELGALFDAVQKAEKEEQREKK